MFDGILSGLVSIATALSVALTPASVPQSLKLINDTRQSKGLSSLTVENSLTLSAKEKCAHMVANDYWAHSGGGLKWNAFIDKYGSPESAGEILAKGFNTTEAQHNGWLNSPSHYDAIVGDYEYFGVGNCTYNNGKKLTVVHFSKEN